MAAISAADPIFSAAVLSVVTRLGFVPGGGGTSTGGSSVQEGLSAGWNSSTGAVQISLAVPQDIVVPYACTLQEVYILTQGGVGACTVDLWKANLSAHFPPVSADDITGGVPPAITSSNLYTNTVLSGWTTALAQGDIIRATLAANSTFTSVKIVLRVK